MLDGNLGSLLYGDVSVMASLFSHMQNVGFLMTWLINFSAVKCTNRRGKMTNLNKVAISHNCILSLIHVRNLHPGANLHPRCKFAPRVYFWPCERCFKNLYPGTKLFAPGCKLCT